MKLEFYHQISVVYSMKSVFETISVYFTSKSCFVLQMITKEIKNYHIISNKVSSALPHQDLRLQHFLIYCSVNQIPIMYQQRAMFDIIRCLPISNDDTRYRRNEFEFEHSLLDLD